MIAFSRSASWGSDQNVQHQIGPIDVTIAPTDNRCLIVNVKTCYLDFCCICIHAPLSTSKDCTPCDFWNIHTPLVQKIAGTRPVTSLIDANSPATATLSGRIDDIVTGKSTVPGFETFPNSTRTWLPVTFPEYGACEPVMTDGKIDEGGGTRIDFVGLTENISCVPGSSETWNSFVMPNSGIDHVPTAIRAHLPVHAASSMTLRRVAKYDRLG